MLPYNTIDDAASLLGRNLSQAETLWFNYSARKSDFFLYSHNTIFLILIFSTAPLLLLAAVQVLRSPLALEKYKIQPKVRLSFSQMFCCYKDVIITFFLVVSPLQLLSYPSIQVRNQLLISLNFYSFI